ncbi:hypothetical protein FBU59_000368 [Linderina macrospora]|uniref:Uncharacterized protein n=1 Tax=Linderina macrospora TaxID=4868 RepID=A0ACC1JH99_9FUNG|nr:hypothetical protein FBU59_000368 [Linderina macrospora]
MVQSVRVQPASPLPAGAPGSCESISDNYQFSKRHKPPLGPLRAVEPHIPSLPDELAVQRGDSVFVLGEFADGWVLAMNASRNNECGMIPRRCLFFSTAQFMTPSAIKASQASQQSQLSRQKPTQKPDPNEKAKPKTPSTDSRHRRRATSDSDASAAKPSEGDEFHIVSRQLPRSTTKVSRETLENGSNIRARLLDTSAKQSLLMEIDARDQKTQCTYEGDYDVVPQDTDEVECVLLYDSESQAFVVERISSNCSVKVGTVSGAATAGAASGQLALPSSTYVLVEPKSKPKGKTASDLEEGSDDDAFALELEGMLNNGSESGDVSRNQSRRGSSSQEAHRTQASDDQLGMELEENIDEILDAVSDDDMFEDVGDAQFPDGGDDVKSLSDQNSDDEIMFEEIPAPIEASAPFEAFEEVGEDDDSEFETVSVDDADDLFGDIESAGASPMHAVPDSATSQNKESPSAVGQDNENSDEFDELEEDLERSLGVN